MEVLPSIQLRLRSHNLISIFDHQNGSIPTSQDSAFGAK